MKAIQYTFYLLLIIGCNDTSDNINSNLARLNNKSWQYSRIIDSLKVQNSEFVKTEIGENLSEDQMLSILEIKLKTDKKFSQKWIEF